MSISNLSIGSDVEKPRHDTLGVAYTKDTGLYPCIVDMAYLGKSAKGAMSLNLHLRLASDNSIIRQTLWVTSGDAKGNRNFYINNGKKFLLPGMQLADQIAHITTGQELGDLTPEPKTIKLWDRDAQAEKPTEVPVLTEMLNKKLVIGLLKIRKNRREQNAEGEYVPVRAERIYNEIDKVFHESGHSVTEKETGVEAEFHQQWASKYGDRMVDNYDENVEDPTDDSLPETQETTAAFDFS
jgi:hypothetical protein